MLTIAQPINTYSGTAQVQPKRQVTKLKSQPVLKTPWMFALKHPWPKSG